ncbi:MAG: helix-turn-helix domain-containing protein [Bryobacteraceae bacterium]
MALPSLYTPAEVARKVKVERQTVYHWLSSGLLRGFRVGSTWRITEEDLLHFMTRHSRRQLPGPARGPNP